MGGLHELGALALRDALAAGQLGAREVTEYFLQRIQNLNPNLGSFVTVTAETALAEADAADARRLAGGPLPSLHGMPIAHKDLTEVVGIRTTWGSAALEHPRAARDSPLAAVLRAAGAISVGKTQVPEFGLSCHSENLLGPPARNPLNPMLSPGGSSGGSAAAVAARMIPFAPGTDGGGSIRIPAAATGLVGLKPNRGRVPAGAGQADLGQLAVAGPLARTAVDAALLLDAMVQGTHHWALRACAQQGGTFLDAAQRAEGRFRIGVSTDSPFASAMPLGLDSAAQAGLAAGIRALQGAGHDLVEAQLSYDPKYHESFRTVWISALASVTTSPAQDGQLTTLAASMRRRALECSGAELAAAVDVLRRFEQETIRQYAQFDMVLTPALAATPRPLGWFMEVDADTDYERQCQYTPYTSMVNVCGLPAITIPTLTTDNGLSMGIQLIGRPSAESQLLAVCAQLEAEF